jgi:hypothetical protein
MTEDDEAPTEALPPEPRKPKRCCARPTTG